MRDAIKKDRITTDETLRETANHGSEEYPFSYYYEDIWDFDFHCIDWHWHPEVEFVYVQQGKADGRKQVCSKLGRWNLYKLSGDTQI